MTDDERDDLDRFAEEAASILTAEGFGSVRVEVTANMLPGGVATLQVYLGTPESMRLSRRLARSAQGSAAQGLVRVVDGAAASGVVSMSREQLQTVLDMLGTS